VRRILETELMEDEVNVAAYAAADFDVANSLFVTLLLRCASNASARARVVDLGCGPGDIAVRLAQAQPGWQIDAVDGSPVMLRYARRALDRADLHGRVRLVQARLPSPALERAAYDVIVSNSLLHHLPDPVALWRWLRRLAKPSADVLMMDLCRPASREQARALVETNSPHEPEVLKDDFVRSLLAAHTVAEVRQQLAAAGLDELVVEQVSDLHLVVRGRLDTR